jgi:hypothetical protein
VALIDYGGYRLLAQSLLPISNAPVIYGSSSIETKPARDAPDDPAIKKHMGKVFPEAMDSQ